MLTPREYQEMAISPVLRALGQDRRALMVMATGLGKTLTSAWTIKQLDKRPGLYLAHSNEILRRAREEHARIFPNWRLGIYNGQEKDIKGADIVFASVQTMHRNLDSFSPTRFKWLVLDEGHHAQARTFKNIIEHFKSMKLAITATPDRMDLKDIRELFGPEVVNIKLEEAIARGWLPQIEYHLMTDDSLNEEYLKELARRVFENGERVPLSQIRRRLFVKAREEKIAAIIEGYGEKAIIFCRDIKRADEFSKILKNSTVYHSSQDDEKNNQAIRELKNGNIRCVCAVNAFNEGIDVPDVGLVVFARSTQSETVFRQQLGRGLRPGKDKLVVLDFAGNIERIRMIGKIVKNIEKIREKITCGPEPEERSPFVVSGEGYEFTFSGQVVEIVDILNRLKVDFYPTWQEAGEAVKKIGIRSQREYSRRFREDPRLPSTPRIAYSDFPGYSIFLGIRNKYGLYPIWEEASRATISLGITSYCEYVEKGKYKQDPRLPRNPAEKYPDFPGWDVFLGRRGKYATWQEAQNAIRRLGIRNISEHKKNYKKDPRLPSTPRGAYSDYPGDTMFFKGKKRFPKYPTWQEAGKVAQRLGAKTQKEYLRLQHKDPRLITNLARAYPNFPGWKRFLGTDK